MGRQVAMVGNQTKSAMTLSTVAAASIAGAAAELRLWVGDNALKNTTAGGSGSGATWPVALRECLNAYIDDSCPVASGAATNFTSYRRLITEPKSAIKSKAVASGALPTVDENTVIMIIGRDFQSQPAAGGAGNVAGTRPGLTPYPVALSGGSPAAGRSMIAARFQKALEVLLEDRKNN